MWEVKYHGHKPVIKLHYGQIRVQVSMKTQHKLAEQLTNQLSKKLKIKNL